MMTEKNINALLAVFFVVLTVGFAFHESETFAGSFPGHLIGIAGAVLMFLTLIYPFKKRIQGKRGRQNPLTTHIFFGLMGPSLVVIHSAHKLESLIGLLTFVSMLVVVLSGIVGRFLFRRVNRTLKEQQRELKTLKDAFYKHREETECRVYFGLEGSEAGRDETGGEDRLLEENQREQCENLLELAQSISELEYATTVFDSTKRLFSKWMKAHHLLSLFLFSFVILHILTVVYYGLRWLP